MTTPRGIAQSRLNPEKVAYWYLRLNGFLQIEDFYVHPRGRGGARTDADLLAVRFPHRVERFYDAPLDIMEDDFAHLALSLDRIDVVIAEVKSGRCALNGPWTDPEKRNLHRVLAAIGCLPPAEIESAAEAIYRTGIHLAETPLQIRLIAIGREENHGMGEVYPNVQQVTWGNVLGFIYDRHQKYKQQKRQTDHWDFVGRELKKEATRPRMKRADFIAWGIDSMGVREVSE